MAILSILTPKESIGWWEGNEITLSGDRLRLADDTSATHPLTSATATYIHLRMQITDADSLDSLTKVAIRDSATGASAITLGFTANGDAIVGAGGTTVTATDVDLRIAVGAEFTVVLYVDVGASGTAACWIDGNEVANFTADTRPDGTESTVDQLYLRHDSNPGTQYIYYDDVVQADTNPGEVQVLHLDPSADGNYTAWSASSGGTLTADVSDSSTATYMHTDSAAQRASFAMDDLGLSGNFEVLAVQAALTASENSATANTLTAFYRISATDYDDGDTIPLGTSPAHKRGTLHTTSPATASAWTSSEVDGMEFGVLS